MTGLRIDIDLEALVHSSWKGMPWRRRAFIWLWPGMSREKIEAEAVRRMRGGKQ
jgi:hypothetical protein